MDLTPGRQRLVFVVVVLALAGLGIFLISSRDSNGTPAAAPSTPASTPPSPAPATTTAGSVPPSVIPAATPVSTAGGAEIYQWLPFSAADLSAAVGTTLAFAKDYATWSYTEDAAAYRAKLSSLVTTQQAAVLENTYDTPGVAGPRKSDKQVAVGTGTIDSIRLFGTGTNPTVSITFVITINQQVTSTQPTAKLNNQYAITVGTNGGNWQVSDIELSALGNQGQRP